MMACIKYTVEYILHPFDKKQAALGVKAWCLVKIVEPEIGTNMTWEPVAIFNYDSEASLFQGHVFASGTGDSVVKISRDCTELFTAMQRRSK